MAKALKAIVALALVLIIMFTTLAVVAAEVTSPSNDEAPVSITQNTEPDLSRAYQLIWRYKTDGTHLWKRRWNATLGEWYDPAWILVY